MGQGTGTRDALYDALKEKAAKNKGLKPEEAVKAILKEFEDTGPAPGGNPTGEELQEALNNYKWVLDKMCPGYNLQLMDKKTMEKRYEYSRECREAMMNIIQEDVSRGMIFDATAEKLFKKDFGNQVAKKVTPFRWADKLIKLGDSDAVRYHNEEVVALAMLANSYKYEQPADKQIAEERFRQTRYEHYLNDLKLPEEEAQKKAKDELKGAMDRLLKLVVDQIEADCPPMEIADQARDAILTGTAGNLPGGLEGAYRKIMSPGAYLAWNIRNTTNDFQSFGRSISSDEYNKTFRPYEMKSLTAHEAVVSHVANPFYAILDGAALANLQVRGLLPKSKGENMLFNAAIAYGGDVSTGFSQSLRNVHAKMLPRFALSLSHDRGVRDQDNDISIYTNERGRTVIFVSNPISTKNGLHITASTDVPGKLINRNFADKMAEFSQLSVAHDQFMHSSGKYRSMKRALKALASTTIPDNINKKQARKLEKRVKALQKATKAYLDRKNKQFRKRGTNEGKDDYEKARYAFAKKMDSYLEDLLPKAKYLREHAETMEKVLSAERSEAKRMRKAKGRLVLQNPDLTPFQRSVQAEDLKIEAEAQRKRDLAKLQKEEAARKAQEETDRKNRKQADEGDALDAELKNVENSIAPEQRKAPMEAPEEMGPALKAATERADQAYQQALDSGDPKQIQARGEDLLATKAVWELIKAGYGLRPDIGMRVQNIAEGGQLDQLVKGMKNNSRFQERLKETDMSSRDAFNQNADSSASMAGKYAITAIKLSRGRTVKNSNNIINTNSSANKKSAMKGGPQAG